MVTPRQWEFIILQTTSAAFKKVCLLIKVFLAMWDKDYLNAHITMRMGFGYLFLVGWLKSDVRRLPPLHKTENT